MNEIIQKKVQQLKSSFTVEGVPLFKSDRFTDEQLAQMKSQSTCHVSHWFYEKVWTDEEIAIQVEAFIAAPNISEQPFKDIVNKIFKALPIEDKEHERKAFQELLFGILNWTEEKNGISDMWSKFGSAPCADDGKFHGNKDLEKYSKLYGACSMKDIFPDFSDKFHILRDVRQALNTFEPFWDEAKHKKDLIAQTFNSPYKDLEDLEDNVVVKKIAEAAKIFYMDKSKDFEDRVEVFTKYGKRETSIYHPSDSDLRKIFDIHNENDWVQRNQIINCVDVVNQWIDNLKESRCHLNWSNPYHPELEKTIRNYTPYEESIKRLRKFYIEKLFLEEVGSFEFDW